MVGLMMTHALERMN